GQGSQHLPLRPIRALCLNVRWKHFVGMSLVVVAGGGILEDNARQPLHTACSDIPWYEDTQGEPMMWWQGLPIHLVRQEHFRTHPLLDGNRATECNPPPAFVHSIQAQKSHMLHLWPDSSRQQHLAQGHSSPDRIADCLRPPGDFSRNRLNGSQFIAPVSGT